MDAIENYRRLFAYDDWANREAAKSLRAAALGPPGRALGLLGHIAGAEWQWLRRLGAPGRQAAVWPAYTLDDCEAEFSGLAQAWQRYLGSLPDEAGLEATVAYLNSKGEPWSSRVEDVLMPVVMHSAYHRGQIASEVRAAGNTPAYTDFIHAVRTRCVR